MASAAEIAFNIIARDGASPAFKTVAAEAKALAASMADADAKMAAGSRTATAEIDASMKTLAAAHRTSVETMIRSDTALVDVTKASATEMAAANEVMAERIAASMRGVVAAQRAAEVSTVQMGRTIATVSAESAAATEAAAAKRKASMMNFGLASAAAVAFVGYESVKMAGNFEQSTNVLVTAAGESQDALAGVRQGILDIAKITGTSWHELVDGMYQVEKAGFRGADGLEILKASAQGAREEGASLKTVTGSLTSALLDYHLPASAAVTITNEMKTAAGEAKATFEEFDTGLGRLLPMTSSLKISLADVSGSLAEMTQHGLTAQDASDQLNNAIRNLAKPLGPAQKMMAQLGIDSTDVSQKLGDGPGGRGLAGTMQYLSTVVLQHMGPAGTVLLDTMNQSKIAAKDADTMFNALPPAAQKVAEAYRNGTLTFAEFRKTTGGLSADQAALVRQWAVTQNSAQGFQQTLKNGLSQNQTYNAMMQTMTGGANGLSVALNLTGENAADTNERIARVADSAKAAGMNVSGWESTQKLFNVQMDRFKQSIDVLMIKLGTDLLPVVTKVFGFLADHTSVVEGLAVLIGTVLVAATVAWTIALQSNPVVLLVEGIALLGVALFELVTHFKEVSSFLGGKWGTIISAAIAVVFPFIGIPMLIMGHWRGLVDFFQHVWHDISAWFFDAWHIINTSARDIGGAALAIGRFFERMWKDVTGFAARMWHDVADFFVRMWRDVAGFAERIWHDVTGFFARIGRDISKAIGDAVDFIGRHWRLLLVIFLGPLGFIIDVVYKFRQQIGGFFERMWHDVSTFASRMWKDVSGFAARMWHDVATFVSRMWHDVATFTARMWHDVAGFAARMWHDVAGFVARMWHDVADFVARMWHDVAGFFSRMWKDVSGFAARIWHDVADFFSRMWKDVTGWVSRLWKDVTFAFATLWHTLVDYATRIWHEVSAPFQSMWDGLKRGFDDVVHGISTAWHKLGEIFRTPINFLIKYVYDDGIVKVWNFVMDVVGEKGKLNPINEIKPFAKGGGTSGPWRGDDRVIAVGGNEHIWTAEEVAAAGGHDRVAAIRSAVVGKPVRVMGDGPGSGYASGGGLWHDLTHNKVTDAAGSAVKGVAGAAGSVVHDILHPSEILPDLTGMVRGFTADVAGPALNAVIDLLGKAIPGNTPVEKATLGMGHSMVDKAMSWIRGQDAKDQAAMMAAGDFSGADGTSAPLIVEFLRAHGIQPGAVTTTGGKHVNGSYHYKGMAVDFGDASNPNQRGIFNVFDAVAGSLLELFWDPAGHYVRNGARIPGAIGGHGDHVHVAATMDAMNRLLGRASAGGFAGGGSLTNEVHNAAAARGWGGQTAALDYIISHESSWNPGAKNPHSTASGLFQLLYGGGGSVEQQITNGFNYIAGRYGNPNNAQRFWQSHGWYANGGMPPVGQPFTVGENGPETMVLGAGGATVTSNANSHRLIGRNGPLMHVENMTVASDVDFELRLKQAQFLEQTAGAL